MNAATIELPTRADEMVELVDVFDAVWGSAPPVATTELLTAMAHAGGYVALARAADGTAVGASLGLLARHDGRPALHSHVTGLVDAARRTGLGRMLKLHQRAWAIEHGLACIVWTFDPLVRRNAWFNLEVLGAEASEYLPSFYGTMSDAINAGDRSDRLLVVWDLLRPLRNQDEIGTTPGRTDTLVATPDDVVALRASDPSTVATWRDEVATGLRTALDDGRPIRGFTSDGHYVIGSDP